MGGEHTVVRANTGRRLRAAENPARHRRWYHFTPTIFIVINIIAAWYGGPCFARCAPILRRAPGNPCDFYTGSPVCARGRPIKCIVSWNIGTLRITWIQFHAFCDGRGRWAKCNCYTKQKYAFWKPHYYSPIAVPLHMRDSFFIAECNWPFIFGIIFLQFLLVFCRVYIFLFSTKFAR